MKIRARALPLVCFVTFFAIIESQAKGWYSQTTPPVSDVNAVAHVDFVGQTAVAADSLGRVLRTANGGDTWNIQYAGDAQLLALSFTLPSGFGTAVGDFGTILRSTDGGVTWTPQLSGTKMSLKSVSFVDANTGTAVGDQGTILRTTDGGDTWTPQDAHGFTPLFGVSFVDANNGIAVGDSGTILLTTNGGDTWTPQPSGTNLHLEKVLFLNASTAFAIGDLGTFLRSADGGKDWAQVQVPGVPTAHLAGISFLGFTQGLAVGCTVSLDGYCENNGIMLRTTDGGATWNTEPYGQSGILFAVSYFNQDTALAVGQEETFLRAPNWYSGLIPRIELYGVSFLNTDVGLAVGYYFGVASVMRTTNGGAIWTQQRVDASHLYGVSFVDANRAIAVGDIGGGIILGTSDAGITWTQRYFQGGTTIGAVSFGDANNGIAVGINSFGPSAGHVWRTSNGGDTWVELAGTFPELGAVSMPNANTAVAVGTNGAILRTTDGGATWAIQWYDDALHGVSLVDDNTGTIVGGAGSILRTTDGGGTWTQQSPWFGQFGFGAVSFVDANTGVALGRSRTFPYPSLIVRTTDGGSTWTLQPTGTLVLLRAASLVDANIGTVVGGDFPGQQIILRTETGGE